MYVENGKELESIKRCIASQIKTSLTEHRPVNQRVVGLIPSQGTCLGRGPGSQFGACERHTLMFLFLSFSFPSSVSKNK